MCSSGRVPGKRSSPLELKMRSELSLTLSGQGEEPLVEGATNLAVNK